MIKTHVCSATKRQHNVVGEVTVQVGSLERGPYEGVNV
jgi:hypothetical protein